LSLGKIRADAPHISVEAVVTAGYLFTPEVLLP
jgi:hypothetical protein